MSYKASLDIEFIDEYSNYFFIPKEYTINNVCGKMISLMPLNYAENVHLSGLKYPLCGENLSIGYRIGIRNYAVNDVVDISYTAGNILLFVSHNKYKDR
jgi:thiamine pyrophosphokinase